MRRRLNSGVATRVMLASLLSGVCLFVIGSRQYSAGRRESAAVLVFLGAYLFIGGLRLLRKAL